MRWPLRYQILVPFAAVMVVLLVAVSLLNAYLAAQQSFRQTVHRLRDVAHTLGRRALSADRCGLAASPWIVRGGVRLDRRRAERAGGQFAAGRAVAAGGCQPASGKSWNSITRRSFRASATFTAALAACAARCRSPGGAVLHLLYPERSWRDARWQAAYPPLLVGALALGPVALLAGAIAGRLSRPIVELRRQVGRIASGDFQPLPLPPHDDELRDLTRIGERPGRPTRRNAAGRQTFGTPDAARSIEWRAGPSFAQRRHRGADRRAASSAPLPTRRSGKPGRGPAPTDPDRTTPAALSGRRPPSAPLPHRLRPARADRRTGATGRSGLPASPGRSAGRCRRCRRHVCQADEEQLRHLLLNLVLNAIEAVPPGGQVRIVSRVAAGEVTIAIHDTGPGPPPRSPTGCSSRSAPANPRESGWG